MNQTQPERADEHDPYAAYVHRVVKEYSPLVDAEPGLLSLLYDIDLLPEQLLHVLEVNPNAAGPNATRMAAVCLLWRVRDPAKWEESQHDRT
jgi:hypothetical protein